MIHNIASKLNTDIIMPYRRMAPQLNRLLYASLFMMVLFGAMMIVLGILATKYQQARRAPGGTTVIKDGRV